MINYQHRLKTVQRLTAADEAVLIANPTDITYLTGFQILVPEEREVLLILTNNHAHLLYSSFSPISKLHQVQYYPGCSPQKLSTHLKTILITSPFSRMRVDTDHLFVNEYQVLQKIPKIKLSNLPTNLVSNLRIVKDKQEVELITEASQLAAAAWDELLPLLKPGITEQAAAKKLECILLELGADKTAFPTIVAFGTNAALPHHQPTDQKLLPETAILLDFGASKNNYRSDMTRSVWIGDHPSELFKKIEQVVHEAYQASWQLLQPGLKKNSQFPTAQQLDTAARDVIKTAGYGKQFIHTTGHGVGLDIHEQPSLNWSNTKPISAGMVITIEPGIYLTGELGYRYENTVIVGKTKILEATVSQN